MDRPATSYVFGAFVLDAAAYQLLADGQPIDLSPKALDLLFLFAGRPGLLLTKDDILGALWADVAVTDNALTQVVSELRQALGDTPAEPRYVQTVPRRGYRFVGAVSPHRPASPVAPPVTAAARTVAVGEFANLSQDAEVAWLSAGLAETVSNGLRVTRDLRLVDRGAGGILLPGASIAVNGAFQRMGDQIRITAEVVDTPTGRALAHAKADGAMRDLFAVQDALVAQIVEALPRPDASTFTRPRPRETSSLDAYRALTDGRLRLETLDLTQVPAAMQAFERALALDPDYALAHAGLAHACLWRFQASRLTMQPDQEALASAIAHARRAVDIDPELAEGHAALAFLLAAAGRSREAVDAGRVATALEPANWRHQFRLGIAAWGRERLEALEAVTAIYPQLAYAYFALAMVHVARGDLGAAEHTLRRGLAHPADRPDLRFPGGGLRWLLGLVRLAVGDTADAVRQFDGEIEHAGRNIFAAEFAMDAEDGLGFVQLAAHDGAGAAVHFERALLRVPEHARSLVGLAAACRQAGLTARAAEVALRATRALGALRAQGRLAEAAMGAACADALADRPRDALAGLDRLLTTAPPGFAGWTIPVEPAFRGLSRDSEFGHLLARLARRAQ